MKKYVAVLVAGVVAIAAWAGPEVEIEPLADAGEMSPIDLLEPVDHSAWERGRHGGRFVVTNISDAKTFNPVVAKETSTTDITDRMFAGIVRRSQLTLEWEPGLAERWDISEDQKTITLYLRSGLTWSDGDPITADEIVWSVNEIYKNEEVETSTRDALIVGDEFAEFELIDDLSYRIVLPSVYAGIFEIASIGPMPRHIFEPLIEADGAAAVNSFWGVDTDVSTIVGNGPFLIDEYVPSERVVMTPNPNYYEKDEWGQQLPYLDEFVIEFVEDQDTKLARFVAGETDALGLRGEDYGVLVDQQESDNFLIYNVGPASSTQFITFNQNPIEGDEDGGIEPPALTWLSNKTFRQAMAHLIDRQTHHQQHRLRLRLPAVLVRVDRVPLLLGGFRGRRLQVRPGARQGTARPRSTTSTATATACARIRTATRSS